MTNLCILILSFYAVIPEAKPVDWCKLDCITSKGIVKNTMCMYTTQKSTFSCHSIRETNGPETIKEILHLHNKFRSDVAGGEMGWPAAANMRQLTWDDALEVVALRWAQQCKPEPDKCRRTPDFHTTGQNYCVLANWQYYVGGPRKCFKGWVEGTAGTSTKIIDSFQGGNWAHLSQIVWAESHKLGCAQVHFRQTGRGVSWKKTALVCNYGPGGNIISEKIYQTGTACSRCPNNTSCRPDSEYPNLCALPNDPTGQRDIISDNQYNTRAPFNGAGTAIIFKFECLRSMLNLEPKCDDNSKIENYPSLRSLVLITMPVLIPMW